MLRIKGAILLLFVALVIIYSESLISIVLFRVILLCFTGFSIFRRVLDAEMKEGTRLGIALANKKEEKQPVNEEDEMKFWTMGLLGKNSAKSFVKCCIFL